MNRNFGISKVCHSMRFATISGANCTMHILRSLTPILFDVPDFVYSPDLVTMSVWSKSER